MENVNDFNSEQAKQEGSGILLIITGLVCAVLSIFFYPFIFGVIGVIMGILATQRGGKGGLAVIVTSIVLMGIGLFLSNTLLSYMTHYLGI